MDMRSERTKGYLREALLDLLHEKPLTEVTVTELAERARVSKNSFYNHYADLDDLAQDCYLQQAVFFRQPRKRLRDYSCRHDAVVETLDEQARLLTFLNENPNLARPLLSRCCTSPYYSAVLHEEEELLLDHIDTEYGENTTPYLDKHDAVRFIAWGMFGIAHRWLLEGMRRDVEYVAREQVVLALQCTAGMAGHAIEPEYLAAIKTWRFERDGAAGA